MIRPLFVALALSSHFVTVGLTDAHALRTPMHLPTTSRVPLAQSSKNSLSTALQDFGRFEGTRYEVVHKSNYHLGAFTNEDGTLLLALKDQLIELGTNGQTKITHLHWPDVQILYLRRNPKRDTIVVGDGDELAAVWYRKKWTKLSGVASSYFRSDGSLAVIPSFMRSIERVPVHFPLHLVIAPIGSLNVGDLSVRLLDDRHDKTKISIRLGTTKMVATIPSRQELEWPGLYFSPTKNGGLLLQVAAREPGFYGGIIFDKRHHRTAPLAYPMEGLVSWGQSASENSILLSTTGRLGDRAWLESEDGRTLREWKSNWTPIWSPSTGTVFYRIYENRIKLAFTRVPRPRRKRV